MLAKTVSPDGKILNGYAPIPVGNGDLSALIDFQGAQFQDQCPGALHPAIWRAGFRYDSPTRPYLPFGYFTQELPSAGPLVRWSQTLDTEKGCTVTLCEYETGVILESLVFCHLEKNFIAIRKKIVRTGGAGIPFTFRYVYGKPRRIQASSIEKEMRIRYDADEQEHYTGFIRLLSQFPLERNLASPEELSMSGLLTCNTFFLVFDSAAEQAVLESDFQTLFESHCSAWSSYWKESFVNLPSEKIMQTYYTAQYELRISSTRWSVPTGLFDTHWHGRYFAFDELYPLLAFLSSGHLDRARLIPDFRFATMSEAVNRASSPGFSVTRFPWETVETGEEAAPPGWWQDHIFHMAHVALGAWNYYLYSRDMDFLQGKGYSLIRACAEFYRLWAICGDTSGRITIGVCTDFERFGSFIRNPFATSCSAIATFRIAAEAALRLGMDRELAGIWRETAEGLITSLPYDGEKFIPYTGCSMRSISIYFGIFPYSVFGPDTPPMKAAIDDNEGHEDEYANMYSKGKVMSTWYAGIKAICAIRFGNPKSAFKIISEAAENTGYFSEIYEIHEKKCRPWFTTGAGMFIHAVNELLLSGEGKNIPDWEKIHFRLRNGKGQTVEK